ncbi:MAG: YceI family protein [Microthrixaceae bacterium]
MDRVKRLFGAHPVLAGLGVLVVVTAGVGALVWNSVFGLESSVVYFGVPDAPTLSAGTDETLYRIDASQSKVTYRVEEKLAGASHTATGTTQGIAGDIALNTANPADSRVGDIVVNVQQLTSDQRLRDERLRHDFLESNDYQTATFSPRRLAGMPMQLEAGTEVSFELSGDLTVKETTKPVTLAATGRLTDDDELHVDATSTVSLAEFGVGPINLVGLATAGDEAELIFELVAVNADDFTDSTRVAAAGVDAPEATGDGPSFAKEVQPILESSCASCHQAGEAGAPFWELERASDATRVADGLALATKSGYMPPFLATDRGVALDHDPRLSDDEIATIGEWAAAGAQLDVPKDSRIDSTGDPLATIDADITLTADAPYQGSTKLTNDYRCLLMDPDVTEPSVVTGYEFVPDQTEFVHHALVYRLRADQREKVDEADADDPGTGYGCFGGIAPDEVVPSPTGDSGTTELITAWAPGQGATSYPEGSGLRMEPGEFFVVQVHYHYVHAAPPDRSELRLEFGDGAAGDYDNVRATTYLAPAEIPCRVEEDGPLCDRRAAMVDLNDRFGSSGPTIANSLNYLCGTTPELLANVDEDGKSFSSCDHYAAGTGEVVAIFGHMHELGETFTMTLNPDTADEQVLLDIDRWDFNWQLSYEPEAQVMVYPGDIIRVECSWDRDLINPASPNRWVSWAEGTEDEMCYSTLTTREGAEVEVPEVDPADASAGLIEPGTQGRDAPDPEGG